MVLEGSFTATVNTELRLGSLEETITVTGESPTVDIQNTTQQRVIDHEVIDTLPTDAAIARLALSSRALPAARIRAAP